ncbi:MAG: ABC transporter substrate-binding protein [Oscillospiraceae bacterium]
MKNSKRTLALLLATLTMTAALSACSGGKDKETTPPAEKASPAVTQKAEPVMGGDLTVGIAQDLDDTLDPHQIISAGTREILFNVYEGLVKPDTKGNIVPAVASEYKISDTGDSFTFTLRDGVTFHNGAPVTVADICYSISRAAGLDTGKPLTEGFDKVASVESTDDKTVVIKLKEPNIEFLAQLTVGIIPKGNDPAVETIGTGPFKFVSRSPQESIVLAKYDKYWGTPAYVDGVTYKIIDNAETLVMSLKSGTLDLVAHLTSAQANELGDEFTVLEGSMNLVQAVYLNNAVEPFNNIKVRQALSYAIDRKMVMDFLADGRGSALGSSMYPAFAKYFRPELVDHYTFDAEKAKALLAEAGYPDGFTMDITVPSNYQPHIDTAKIIAEQLAAVGVKANVELVDWETWLNDVYLGRKFQSTIVGVDAAVMTARAMLERFTSDAGNNFINFKNDEYDKTFKEAMSCVDDAKQVELYGKLQTILTEDAANLYIQDLCDLVVMGKNVGGYEFYPIYIMDMSKVYFTK